MRTIKAELSSRDILLELAKGRNPFSDDPLPGDSILNKPQVIRALLEGAESLDQTLARAQRRALLPRRTGVSWSEDEDRKLTERFQAGATPDVLAPEHERSIRAVVLRLQTLGHLPANQPGDPSWLTGARDRPEAGAQRKNTRDRSQSLGATDRSEPPRKRRNARSASGTHVSGRP